MQSEDKVGRTYVIDGRQMTAEEVAAIENPTDSQKQQFIKQSGVTDRDLQLIRETSSAILTVIPDGVKKLVWPLAERLRALEAKVAELETRGVEYKGVWQRALSYHRGNITTHKRGAWVALSNTGDEPGESPAWQLMVPAGRDGKDAR